MSAHVKLILTASFAVLSIAGVSVIYTHWTGSSLSSAVLCSVVFVLITAVLHAVGFALYARQFSLASAGPTAPMKEQDQPRPEFLRVVLLQQIPLPFLTALLLDGRRTFRGYCVGAIAHWSLIAIILVRRRGLSRIDVFLVRWGFIPLVILAGLGRVS